MWRIGKEDVPLTSHYALLHSPTLPTTTLSTLSSTLTEVTSGSSAPFTALPSQGEVLVFLSHLSSLALSPPHSAAALSALTSVFRTAPNATRALILRLLPRATRILPKLSAALLPLDPLLESLVFVTSSNDPAARALALSALSALPSLSARRIDVRHALLAGLASPDRLERTAAISTAAALASAEPNAADAVMGYVGKVLRAQGRSDMAVHLLPLLLAINKGNPACFDDLVQTLVGFMGKHPDPHVLVPSLDTLAALLASPAAAAASLAGGTYVKRLAPVLDELVENAPALGVRKAALGAAIGLASHPVLHAPPFPPERVLDWLAQAPPGLVPSLVDLLGRCIQGEEEEGDGHDLSSSRVLALLPYLARPESGVCVAPLVTDMLHSLAPDADVVHSVEAGLAWLIQCVCTSKGRGVERLIASVLKYVRSGRGASPGFVLSTIRVWAQTCTACVQSQSQSVSEKEIMIYLRGLAGLLAQLPDSEGVDQEGVDSALESVASLVDVVAQHYPPLSELYFKTASLGLWIQPSRGELLAQLGTGGVPGVWAPDAVWNGYRFGIRAAQKGHFGLARDSLEAIVEHAERPWVYWCRSLVDLTGACALVQGREFDAAGVGLASSVLALRAYVGASASGATSGATSSSTRVGSFQLGYLEALQSVVDAVATVDMVGSSLGGGVIPSSLGRGFAARVGHATRVWESLWESTLGCSDSDVGRAESVARALTGLEDVILEQGSLERALSAVLTSLLWIPARMFDLSPPPQPLLYVAEANEDDVVSAVVGKDVKLSFSGELPGGPSGRARQIVLSFTTSNWSREIVTPLRYPGGFFATPILLPAQVVEGGGEVEVEVVVGVMDGGGGGRVRATGPNRRLTIAAVLNVG